jgi:ADP-heptose:LPS heptosyltransferase
MTSRRDNRLLCLKDDVWLEDKAVNSVYRLNILGNIVPLDPALLRRIVVFRALPGLGDFLCVTPALRALRVACPQAQITLIGSSANRGLIDRFSHLIDELIEFAGYPGLPEQSPDRERFTEFQAEMRDRKLDLAIQMHGSGVVTNSVVRSLGASRTAGFFVADGECPDRDSFLPFEESESEVRRYLRLMALLGIPAQKEALEFPLVTEDWQTLQTIKETHKLSQNYVCIHPGASVVDRRWAAENFASVGDVLAEMDLQVVLTGSVAEVSLAESVIQKMRSPALNLAGCTNLGTLAALLGQARLLICNDTGVSHLAAALQTPSVVVFSGSDPQRWAPLDLSCHRAIHNTVGDRVALVIKQAKNLLEEEMYIAG